VFIRRWSTDWEREETVELVETIGVGSCDIRVCKVGGQYIVGICSWAGGIEWIHKRNNILFSGDIIVELLVLVVHDDC